MRSSLGYQFYSAFILVLVFSISRVDALCPGATRTDSSPHYGLAKTGEITASLISSGVPSSVINEAITQWTQTGCGAGTEFPKPISGGSGDFSVTVVQASTSGDDQCGVRQGNQITLYSFARINGSLVRCESQAVALAHEFGHWLGLGHTSEISDCNSYIMYPKVPATFTPGRSVQSQECTEAAEEWVMFDEEEHPDNPNNPNYQDPNRPDDPSDECSPPDCTPILIDLDGNGLRLSGLEDAVRFDIDADGRLENLGWTAAMSDDVFLALDRNYNGAIDDGRELFGGVTPQPATAEANGFLALAVFDEPAEGGNGDGLLTSADTVFSRLLLWGDRNHDGRSQPFELKPISASVIEAIDLSYQEVPRRDRYGNKLRYLGKVTLWRKARRAMVDVIFVSK